MVCVCVCVRWREEKIIASQKVYRKVIRREKLKIGRIFAVEMTMNVSRNAFVIYNISKW